jgi:hypothetical protein
MNEIKKEFEAYLKEVIKSTSKPADLKSKSHLFNRIINDKHKEILSNNPNITEMELKIELAPIRVKYQIEFVRN